MVAIWGHRGASADAPENTVEAFVEAARQGAEGVELDVRRTADGALAVVHDPVIAGLGPVAELKASELPASVVLLDEALDVCAGAGLLTVNVEIKNIPGQPGFDESGSLAAQVAEMVAAWRDLVVVSAFHLATIDAVRAADSAIRTGWLTPGGFDQLKALETVLERGHSAFHPEEPGVTAEVCGAAHAAGVPVYTWTVDDPQRIRALAACGVDSIMTNCPAVAIAALARDRADGAEREG